MRTLHTMGQMGAPKIWMRSQLREDAAKFKSDTVSSNVNECLQETHVLLTIPIEIASSLVFLQVWPLSANFTHKFMYLSQMIATLRILLPTDTALAT